MYGTYIIRPKKYDIRILNVLATIGLKASSIAHEMRNDRNSISANTDYIILALQEYGMWDELSSPEKTKKAFEGNHTSYKITAAGSGYIARFSAFQPNPSYYSDMLKYYKKLYILDSTFNVVSVS